jgi:hypothetical protein
MESISFGKCVCKLRHYHYTGISLQGAAGLAQFSATGEISGLGEIGGDPNRGADSMIRYVLD